MYGPAGAIAILSGNDVAQPAIRKTILTTIDMTHRIGPEPRKTFFQIIGVVNAMKDALLHHLIQSRTLVADLSAPDGCFAIPDRIAMHIFHIEPEILKPALVRRLILDLMGLVVDPGGEIGRAHV